MAAIKQIFLFGAVGITSSLTHLLMVYLFVNHLKLQPAIANIFAFLIAYPVSFFGHSYLTFASRPHRRHLSFYRFLIVAVLGFLLNEGLYLIFLYYTSFHYLLSLGIILIIVPAITFVLSKFWAFSN